jgi:hypothetical protein
LVSQITLESWDKDGFNSTAWLRMHPDSRTVEFEVQLYGIPGGWYQQGKEVTANWQIADFDNNGTFYTDSNALEMQKRVLNYRPTWALD